MKAAADRDRYAMGALGIYLALAMLFFGRGLAGHFADFHVGKNLGDPGQCIWFLSWLPHALASGHNPVSTNAIWAPAGMNLSWTTWLPLEALIAWPITAVLGPVASYNFLALVSLPLAAWSAFVLCRHVSGSWWAALVGGYLFGFSGYMLYYLWTGDLNLIAVFPIPLAVYAVVRAYEGGLPTRAGGLADASVDSAVRIVHRTVRDCHDVRRDCTNPHVDTFFRPGARSAARIAGAHTD